MNATSLREAHATLLQAVDHVSASPTTRQLNLGEWDAHQILGHVSLLQGALLSVVSAVAAGHNAAFDTRIAHNPWTIHHVAELTGGIEATAGRVRALGDALATLVEESLTESELETPVAALLISSDQLFVDAQIPLRMLVAGFADNELAGHTQQLLDLTAATPR